MTKVGIGAIRTDLGFEKIAPSPEGDLPRNEDGEIEVFASMQELLRSTPSKIDIVQVHTFAHGNLDDYDELISKLQGLGLRVQTMMMIGPGVNPMDPDSSHEDEAVRQLLFSLGIAKNHNISEVNSTSLEAWMQKDGLNLGLDARVEQLAKLHSRVHHEAALAKSCVQQWNVEFLRPKEFHFFTNIGALEKLLHALATNIGNPFFKALIDTAHCADSGWSQAANRKCIERLAKKDQFGAFHCSAPTTRGHYSSDEGWIGFLLAVAAKTGKLKNVFAEVFMHDDPALEKLCKEVPGFGVDTTQGLKYPVVVVQNLIDIIKRLNTLKVQGHLESS